MKPHVSRFQLYKFLLCLFVIGLGSFAFAMGSTPPATAEAEPEYKAEILKMDVTTAPQTLESKTKNKTDEAKPKYKLEILKMDVITAPSSEFKTPDQTYLTTEEVKGVDFWQEADITFWQTLPFATLWGFIIDGTLSGLLSIGGAPHWTAIVSVAAIASAGNAVITGQKAVEKQE